MTLKGIKRRFKILQKMSYETIQAIADAELAEHGLDVLGWRHEFDDETVHVGCCWSGRKLIMSSRHYIANGLNAEQIVDTIRHEMAHALDKGTKYSKDGRRLAHGKSWKVQCAIVGARPTARANMEGYIDPAKKTAKWTMVLMAKDKKSVEYFRHCKKFLSGMASRWLPSRPDTSGRFYLVDTKDYNAYTEGHKELSALKFWQTNPNDDFWGTPRPTRITP